MKDTQQLKDTIELYIKGKLQHDELSEIESLIGSDPKIANEVELQKLISSGIKENRMAMLKARLDNINVPSIHGGSSISNTISKFGAIKAASIVLVCATLGIGAYYFTQNKTKAIASNTELVSEEIDEVEEFESNTAEDNITQEPLISRELKPIQSKSVRKIESDEDLDVDITKTMAKANAEGEKLLDEKFAEAQDADIKTGDDHMSKEQSKHELVNKSTSMDIKNIQEGKYGFHYTLKDNVLYLYGKFDASPYEILEFNDDSNKKMFLYYNKTFFELKSNQPEIAKLKKISQKGLREDLEEARLKRH